MSTANKLLQAASGGGDDLTYVEDVFSTDLWAGDGSSETITNGIDFSGEGGMVWFARRTTTDLHAIIDTERGGSKALLSTSQSADYTNSQMITSFNSNGFAVGSYAGVNENNEDLVGWSFRKSAGFFDVVTYSGDGTSNRTISHNLGCKPGMIWVKRRNDASANWQVWHRNSGYTYNVAHLNTNDTWTNTGSDNAAFGSFVHSDTTFTLGAGSRLNDTNASGGEYVAYLFAGTADSASQIFGDNADEGVIKVGSYTGNGTDKTVSVGFEPQWVIIKNTANTDDWWVVDMMRGVFQGSNDALLKANANDAEDSNADYINFDVNGFTVHTSYGIANENGSNYIYMAIRRPMKAPEYGTDVFTPTTYSGNSSSQRLTSTGIADLAFLRRREGEDWVWSDRLGIGPGKKMRLNRIDDIESDSEGIKGFDHNDGIDIGDNSDANGSSYTYVAYMLTRATGFFDVVAWTGSSGTQNSVDHGLGVKPELVILKYRGANDSWYVYTSAAGYLTLDGNGAASGSTDYMGSTTTTSLNVTGLVSNPGLNPIGYLFATVAGVSKVGSYTGTGSDLNVDCGFSAGARFVLIKRTDSSGDWYIWDSARGIVAGNDPYVLANSNSAEVTNTDYIDPLSTGFTVTAAASSTVNVSSGTYIFLAIAQR